MTPEQQQALFDNTARAMGDLLDFIKYRTFVTVTHVIQLMAKGVAKALGLTVENAQAARETLTLHVVYQVLFKSLKTEHKAMSIIALCT